jgi:dihydroorotase
MPTPCKAVANTLQSRGHNTPFMGWEFKGRVTHTLLAGSPVYSLENDV